MIQAKVKSKQYHGQYYIATIYESRAECISHGGVIVDYKDREQCKKGTFVESIEGYLVPVLQISLVGVNRFIYFPRLRFNAAKKVFSYNIDLLRSERYRLSFNEKLLAGYIGNGEAVIDSAMRVWPARKKGYYIVAIKRLFNNSDFTDYLFNVMGNTLREELEARGINKGTIADEIASAITQKDKEGNSIRVPQNVRLWALGKASDVLERGGQQQGNITNNVLVVSPDAIRQQMQSRLSPMQTDHQALDVSSGNLALEAMASVEPYIQSSSQAEENLQQ